MPVDKLREKQDEDCPKQSLWAFAVFRGRAPKERGSVYGHGLKKYASTGGWGFAQFDDGKPAGEAVLKTCFPCHEAIEARDLVITRYAP